MICIAGLGNPGERYEHTRHNIGYMILDYLCQKNGYGQFQHERKFHADCAEGMHEGEKILLIKPLTFMNRSGIAVREALSYYHILPSSLWVVHDEIDLLLGEMKIGENRGSAGHKGVESLVQELGTNAFVRFRIGVNTEQERQATESFVLQPFRKEERAQADRSIDRACEALNTALKEGVQQAMNEYNKKNPHS